MVLLTGGLPRQESELARNDREFAKFQFVDLLIDPDKQEIKAAIQ